MDSNDLPPLRKLLRLVVYVRNSDAHNGKSVSDALIELYRKNGIVGATVLQGVKGYGVRGASRVDVLGLSVNLPVVIETVDERQKVLVVLPEVKNIVEGNGLITLDEVDAV
jgi:uncharacterized protein